MACAAFRERVNPALMSATPAAASGASKAQKKGKIAGDSGIGWRTSRRNVSTRSEDEAQRFDGHAGEHESRFGHRCTKQANRGDHDGPSRQHQ